MKVLRIFLAILFSFFAPACFAQSWSNILTNTRAITWTSAGLPASITYGSGGGACTGSGANCVETISGVYTPPTRTQCGTTIASGASEATIQSAISACHPGGYVLLASGGSWSITTALTLANGVTLRGAGGSLSTLNVTGGPFINIDLGTSQGTSTAPLTSASSNFTAGTTSFIITTASPPSVGELAWINQCNTGLTGNPCTGTQADNSGIFICVLSTACNTNGGTPNSQTNASEQQNFIVTSVTNNGGGTYTIGVSNGLYAPNWSFGQTPRMTWQNTNQQGMGLEDLTVFFPYNQQDEIQFNGCYGCWVKGVRIVGAPSNRQLGIESNDKNTLILNSYFYTTDPAPANNSTALYTCIQYGQDSDTLFLNDIQNGCIFESEGGSEGNVFAYTYMRDSQTAYSENAEFQHADQYSGGMFNLREGEEVGTTYDDDTWGTKDLNTWFRNYAEAGDPPYQFASANARGITADNWSRVENAVGNVAGSSYVTTYQITNSDTTYYYCWGFGTGEGSGTSGFNYTTFLRWGNVCSITQATDTPANSGVRFVSSEVPSSLSGNFSSFSNSVPGSHTLPCSFFLGGYTSTTCTPHSNGGTGLSWWKVCLTWTTFPTSCATSSTQPFPPIGPDVTSGPYVNGYAYDIPAMIAWKNLPIDATYQHTYTITASSWTSGTETLTVSGLPSSNEHLIGGFEFSGVSASCGTGEQLITTSTTTTIAYALGSNPGANACTGSFLFPDVRQFDERVYETDSGGGGGTVATPTFSPVAGGYTVVITPTITTATSGATICYTTNGIAPTAPTAGTCGAGSTTLTNGGTITVSSSETVEALGTLSGSSNSAVATAVYFIGTAPATVMFGGH